MALLVGQQKAFNTQAVATRGDFSGATAIQQVNGKYAELVRQGQVYNCSVTTAAALLIANTTACGPTIWNPSGSGVITYVLQHYQNWLSGVTVAGSCQWHITRNTGSAIGTAAPIVTFTGVAPVNVNPNGPAAVSQFAPAVSTFTAAPSFWLPTGINLKTEAGDYMSMVDYDGVLAVYPGQAITLCYSVATSTALYFNTFLTCEVPLLG